MKEIKYTHRTRDGRKARIIGSIVNSRYPVVIAIKNELDGEEGVVTALLEDLRMYSNRDTINDLVSEITPYDDWPIDAKILVWDKFSCNGKHKRHFAGVVDGKPSAWHNGGTSWSVGGNGDPIIWENAELVED